MILSGLEISPYRLKRRDGSDEREGALLRCHFKDGTTGYASLFSWPEFEDPTLAELLSEVRLATPHSALLKRALEFAELDGWARARRMRLWKAPVPSSHYLVMSNDIEMRWREIHIGSRLGFRSFKIKCMARLEDELEFLNAPRWNDDWREFDIEEIKLDFNGRLLPAEYLQFCENLSGAARDRIAYIEDPLFYTESDWSKFPRPPRLAVDLISWSEKRLIENCLADGIVIKPARQNAKPFQSFPGFVSLTSYLDHPLGQAAAAWTAAELAMARDRVVTCGLQSHLLYQPNEFSEVLGSSATWKAPAGYGFGFDMQLADQDWKRWI